MDQERPDTAALEQEVRDLRAMLGAALARIDHLDRALAPSPPSPPPIAPGAVEVADGTIDRRRAIRGAALAAGAAAAGLVLGDARPAAAANGSNLVVGVNSNTATSQTVLTVSDSSIHHGLIVTEGAQPGPTATAGVAGSARGTVFTSGVYGHGINDAFGVYGYTSGTGDAVHGWANTGAGVYGTSGSGPGVTGENNSTTGIGVNGVSAFGTAVKGTTNDNVGVAGVANSGTGAKGTSTSGIGVVGTSTTNVGVAGNAQNAFGVQATSTAGTGLSATGAVYGVSAQSSSADPSRAAITAYSSAGAKGVAIETETGQVLAGLSNSGGGISVVAPQFHLRFGNAETRGAPTSDGFGHVAGDIVASSTGELWVCVGQGTPGSWRKLASPAAAGAFHVLAAPVRIYDSRAGSTPAQGPKTKLPPGGSGRPLDCTVNGSGVPIGATAVSLTVLLVNANNGNGNVTVWANGVAKPASNTMVWGAGSGRWTTSTISALDATGKIQVAASAETDIVIDVVGYYR
ncbi:MAG: hypothetical protein ACTHN0_11425 [Aquihabitans sp.]